ncbi:MAG: hypothetical protein E4H05_02410 [Acidimicrobiales bacterium]|nr:MAG: hypothetical protein E4H05_02410 [Acidimicrobiales bacterium]
MNNDDVAAAVEQILTDGITARRGAFTIEHVADQLGHNDLRMLQEPTIDGAHIFEWRAETRTSVG